MSERDSGQPPVPGNVMVAAFDGWNDAGRSATEAVQTLLDTWPSTPVTSLGPGRFYDLKSERPTVRTDRSGRRELTWPCTSVWRCEPDPGRVVLLVRGPEPTLNWEDFALSLVDIARAHDVDTVVTLGGLLADVPHTRPVPVQLASDSPWIRDHVPAGRSTYRGPTGITGVLSVIAAREGLADLSAWAAIPHYVAGAPHPGAMVALLEALERATGITAETAELLADAAVWRQNVDRSALEDPDIAAYVRSLESSADAHDMSHASGDDIAREVERFLRRQEDDS